MTAINVDRAVQSFLTLVQIDSVTYEEQRIIQHVTAAFEALGFTVVNDGTGRDGAGNLLIRLPGTRPEVSPILLSAHTDTVGARPWRQAARRRRRDPERWHHRARGRQQGESGRSSRGNARCSRKRRLPHRAVELVLTWGEERGTRGRSPSTCRRLSARMGATLDDAAPPGRVTVAAPAYRSIRARFIGRAAHAGADPERGISAIVASAPTRSRGCGSARLDHETTANVGIIRGGTARNAIPEWSNLRRKPGAGTMPSSSAWWPTCGRPWKRGGARGGRRRSNSISSRSTRRTATLTSEPIVQEAMRAVRAVGLTPALGESGGGSDANTFNEKGIRCVNLGIGMADMHTVNESIRIADLGKTCELALALMTGG
mgnify:CR=1 FL=1